MSRKALFTSEFISGRGELVILSYFPLQERRYIAYHICWRTETVQTRERKWFHYYVSALHHVILLRER